jgi:hypothetical protein
MKLLSMAIWLLSAIVVPSAYGGVRHASSLSGDTSGPSSPEPQGTKQAVNITGNWQFSTKSTVPPGIPSWTIAGSLSQSAGSLGAVLHVDGSSCFDQPTSIRLTGSYTHGIASLTSVAVDGQVIAISGRVGKLLGLYKLTGTYAISGGCADGQQGNVTGYTVDSLTGYWAGDLTTAAGGDIWWDTQLTQLGASSEGSFGLQGTVDFGDTCFKSGTIKSGTFPTASFIMGRSVALDIKTDNGTISFRGTADTDGLIRGIYTVTDGPCQSTGTGYLSPWDY